MLWRRLFHPVLEFDQEQVDGALIDEPDAVRVVEFDRQVAAQGTDVPERAASSAMDVYSGPASCISPT